MIPILPASYFGSVELYRLLALHEHAVIDVDEHYVRQSYRTRTRIVGPNGPQDLSVQIEHDHGSKMPMREVRLSYSETWPQQHLHAIRSAYGNAPWFIHYIDEIEQLLAGKPDRLIDLNLATMRLALRWLGVRTELQPAGSYMEAGPDQFDLRTSLHPKKPLPAALADVQGYTQVFEQRHGFVPRTSVIDLVMNLGPEAHGWLLRP